MSKTLIIHKVSRQTEDGEIESLVFQPGINIIKGEPDAGKTVWLKMLDYLLGDISKPEDAIGAELAEKYRSLSAEIEIDEEKLHIERQWKVSGKKTKILIDEEAISDDEFSSFILNKLGIPILHFPKGNPYAERTWPSLSWRMIYRHIYRQERFWSDLADQQPEQEQYAVLSLFLGIAEKTYSPKLGEIIEKRKRLYQLQARKEQFESLLDSIARRMTDDEGNLEFATPDLIKERISKLKQDVQTLLDKRESVLSEGAQQSYSKAKPQDDLQLAERRSRLVLSLDELVEKAGKVEKRLTDLIALKNSIADEANKLQRSKAAGTILSSFRVTHCPVCEQPVEEGKDSEVCYLCHRPISLSEGTERLDFEIAQLESQEEELQELITRLKTDQEILIKQRKKAESEIEVIEKNLIPIRTKIGAIVDPVISLIDTNRGRLEEKIKGYHRLLETLEDRDNLTKEIDSLSSEISIIEASMDETESELKLEKVSDDIEDGIMTYLSKLNDNNAKRWLKGRVHFEISDRLFRMKINNAYWKAQLGATLTCYLLLAYHYSLMTLTLAPSYHYPGLCIVDFPPVLADGTELTNEENYLILPFISLLSQLKERKAQCIFAGRAFQDLDDVNIIELNTVWT